MVVVLSVIPPDLYSYLSAFFSVKLRRDETCVVFMIIPPNSMLQLYFISVKL
jgi:hypothetical protein